MAIALWKEPIRECKILATLLMPTDKLLPEVAEIWMEQTETQEMAELLALHVFQYVDYAPRVAFARDPPRPSRSIRSVATIFSRAALPRNRSLTSVASTNISTKWRRL